METEENAHTLRSAAAKAVPFFAFVEANVNEISTVRVLKNNDVIIVFLLRIRTNFKAEQFFRAICSQYVC